MKVKIFKTAEEIGKCAAEQVKDKMIENPHATLGLATGSSPIKLYENLIKMYQNGEISFADITSFNLDEYANIEPTHVQSYLHFMNEHLFDHVDIKKENINIPSGVGNLEKICREYNDKLSRNTIDIQILGIGTNGHIAFNEPGTAFSQKTHVTTLAEQTISDNARFFETIADVPTQAISMGLANIMEAKKVILIATGKSKAEAVKGMIQGEITEQLPASILQKHDDVLVILDDEAASSL